MSNNKGHQNYNPPIGPAQGVANAGNMYYFNYTNTPNYSMNTPNYSMNTTNYSMNTSFYQPIPGKQFASGMRNPNMQASFGTSQLSQTSSYNSLSATSSKMSVKAAEYTPPASSSANATVTSSHSLTNSTLKAGASGFTPRQPVNQLPKLTPVQEQKSSVENKHTEAPHQDSKPTYEPQSKMIIKAQQTEIPAEVGKPKAVSKPEMSKNEFETELAKKNKGLPEKCYSCEALTFIWEHESSKSKEYRDLLEGVDKDGNKNYYTENINNFHWSCRPGTQNNPRGLSGEIQSLLNKLTLENFDSVYPEIRQRIPATYAEFLDIIDVLYDKVVMESYFGSLYAKLCMALTADGYPSNLDTLLVPSKDENGKWRVTGRNSDKVFTGFDSEEEAMSFTKTYSSVRRLIAMKCKKGLESKNNTDILERERDQIKADITAAAKDSKKTTALEAELMNKEFEINTARRRTFGNVQFIGELFNCGLLRLSVVIQSCFDSLLTSPEAADDEKTEALVKLLRTVGKNMYNNVEFSPLLDDIMMKMEKLAESPVLTSRIRFAVKDLLDLGLNGWQDDSKEKLEKLSVLRTQKTIEKLQSILDMLLARGSTKKSVNASAPVHAADVNLDAVKSEVMEVKKESIEQIDFNTYTTYNNTIKSGLSEAKQSKDAADFWYYLTSKSDELKEDLSRAVASMTVYCAENLMVGSNDLNLAMSYIPSGIESGDVKKEDIRKGILSSLQQIDFLDSPKRYENLNAIIKFVKEKELVDVPKFNEDLEKLSKNESLNYVCSKIM